MKYFKKIEGQKVFLSPLSTEDAELYTSWINNKYNSDRTGGSSNIIGLENEKTFINNAIIKGLHIYAIILNTDTIIDKCIGICSLNDIDTINARATLGIFIGEENYRGKGYGTESIKLLVKYGFDTLRLNNIMLFVYDFNEIAIKSYQKVGFKKIGHRRQSKYIDGGFCDEIIMDLICEEYEN